MPHVRGENIMKTLASKQTHRLMTKPNFLIILFIFPLLDSPFVKGQIVHTFYDPTAPNSTLNNHLVVHKETGFLYVGAVNRIYQFDPNLKLVASNKTGPYEDSTECSGLLTFITLSLYYMLWNINYLINNNDFVS